MSVDCINRSVPSGEVASDTLRQVGEAIRTGNDCAMFVPDDPKVMCWLKAAQKTMPKGAMEFHSMTEAPPAPVEKLSRSSRPKVLMLA